MKSVTPVVKPSGARQKETTDYDSTIVFIFLDALVLLQILNKLETSSIFESVRNWMRQ